MDMASKTFAEAVAFDFLPIAAVEGAQKGRLLLATLAPAPAPRQGRGVKCQRWARSRTGGNIEAGCGWAEGGRYYCPSATRVVSGRWLGSARFGVA